MMTSLGEVARRPGVLFFKWLFSKPNSHFFFFFFFWGGGGGGGGGGAGLTLAPSVSV